ncbi:MAG TPA: DNA alkylation response protein [Intrasporangiaceae bacterium]|nr:DNA alkylation response protein [Intrasporangiaceae bacterium]
MTVLTDIHSVPSGPHRTHEVTNQAPPRVDRNEFADNTALVEAVDLFASTIDSAELHEIGRHVGTADYQRDAQAANNHPPIHHPFDRWGNRVDEIEFHDSYHRLMRYSIEHGLHTGPYANPGPGATVARIAKGIVISAVEAGHGCPISMTNAAVPSLRHSPELAQFWEPRLLSTVYDPELRDPATKSGVTFGMSMTEKQGGSDLRANTTTAQPSSGGTYLLRGHKWFCSAPQSDAFLMLAQAPRGLSCFLVPRILPGGERNPFLIQRLKDKLGNRSNSSSEIELDATHGWLVGEEGRGVRTIIEMINHTRMDCVMSTTAGMRAGVAEAAWHARHRAAFGATLIDQPAMGAVIADLQLESEAATWATVRLAATADDPEQAPLRRLLTAVLKFWICQRGPNHAFEAMTCLGGNGYTEAFPLARLYREQPVLAIWEGTGSVIALDVLRALHRDPDGFEMLDTELRLASGTEPIFDAHLDRTRSLLTRIATDPESAQRHARRLVEDLALAFQAAVLLQHAPSPVAEAFCLARLGDGRGMGYGGLPDGVDIPGLVARA